MINYQKALGLVLKNAKVLPVQKIKIENALGRITVKDIYSKISMPAFNKSAMDGYALKASDVKHIPARLKCVATVGAGENFSKKIKSGECVKIMTGAPVSTGCDAVVMVEHTSQNGSKVEILKSVKKGRNVCFLGEDFKAGKKIISKATVIKPQHIGLLVSAGISYVDVIAPKVSVLNTGTEIVPIGKKLPKNTIYNSNGPMLCSLLENDNIAVNYLGISKDTVSDLKAKIKKGLGGNILIISGGVSMGDYDLVPQALKELGVKQIFHKVCIKPGKPLFFGIKNKTLIFGLPGNPIANFLGYHLFIKSALLKMSGYKKYIPKFREGVITQDFYKKGTRRQFVLVNITQKSGKFYLTPLSSRGSADVLSLSKADGFMSLAESVKSVRKNTTQKFFIWK